MKAIEEEGSDTTTSETQKLTNGNIMETEENKKSTKDKMATNFSLDSLRDKFCCTILRFRVL